MVQESKQQGGPVKSRNSLLWTKLAVLEGGFAWFVDPNQHAINASNTIVKTNSGFGSKAISNGPLKVMISGEANLKLR